MSSASPANIWRATGTIIAFLETYTTLGGTVILRMLPNTSTAISEAMTTDVVLQTQTRQFHTGSSQWSSQPLSFEWYELL